MKTVISVIDDDPSMSRMLQRVIAAAGFEVVCFASAEDFLNSVVPDQAACLVLDVNLPGMSGIDLQQHLTYSGRQIPIIFISGQADETIKRRVLDAGAAGFFNKPFRIDALLATVRGLPALALN